MLKRYAFICLMILSLLLSVSCGKDETGKIKIRFLDKPDTGGAWQTLIEQFEKTHPDIDVELVEGPPATNDREDLYAKSFLTGEAIYDLVFMDIIWVAKFAAAGWLRPLDDYFLINEQEKFLPGDIAGSKYHRRVGFTEDHIYRVPIYTDAGMLYYRKDILQAKGLKPPETWSELVEYALELQKPPQLYGLVFQGMQYEGLICCFLELVWSAGGELIDESGKVRIDSAEAIEALEWLCAVVNQHKITPPDVTRYQEDDARRVFQEGQALFMRNWPYAWTLAQAEDSPIKGKVGIIPMVHQQGKQSAATLGGWGFGISKFTQHAEAAWKFIRFAASAEAQKIRHFKDGAIPTRHSLFKDKEILAESPHYPDLYRILLTARPRPMHSDYAHISDILQEYVSAALVGKFTPQEALQKSAREINSLLQRRLPTKKTPQR